MIQNLTKGKSAMKSNTSDLKYHLVVLNPYFGKLPEMFSYWLKTCEYNSTIDWIVFTDDECAFNGKYDTIKPRNVRFVKMMLSEVKTRIENVVGFQVPLYRPYKICDYRPAYGLIFEDYVKNYDFWGYSDLDVLFGNLRKFITDDILNSFDRIYTNGYLSFYRNTREVNNWFRTLEIKPGRENWKEVFSTEQNWEFDEYAGHRGGGITHIIEDNKKPIYIVKDWANIIPRYGSLNYYDHGVAAENVYFTIAEDGIYTYDAKTRKPIEEVSFIHMFRRPPVCKANISNKLYYLSPNIISNEYFDTRLKTWIYHLQHKVTFDLRNSAGLIKRKMLHCLKWSKKGAV